MGAKIAAGGSGVFESYNVLFFFAAGGAPVAGPVAFKREDVSSCLDLEG
jgi:hypothetical protein